MKKLLLLILISFSITHLSLAQNKITGSITDEKDQPVAGANVIIKGKLPALLQMQTVSSSSIQRHTRR